MSLQFPAGPALRTSPTAALDALRGQDAVRIPKGLAVQGEAHYPCDLNIEGNFDGTVTIDAMVLVAPGAHVSGLIAAGHAYIEGRVDGEVDCSNGAVEFTETAQCKALVRYRELSVARGADVEADLQQVGARGG